MIISSFSYAKRSCKIKSSQENKQFSIDSKVYKFTSYFCEDENDEEEIFEKKAILEVQAKNTNKLYKNVIGIRGMLNIAFEAWNNQPALYYFMPAAESIEAHIPIIVKNNDLMVQCIYKSTIKKFYGSQLVVLWR